MPSPHDTLFSAVRSIPAADAAERLNILLHRRGDRAVALCPLHSETTPSLTFYSDGRFYCFGCHEHGGAIELYQKVLEVSALEAARVLASDFNIIEPEHDAPAARKVPVAHDLKRLLDNYKSHRWRKLCDHKRIFNEIADIFTALLGSPEICAESDSFWAAVQGAASIEIEMGQLEDADPAELLALAGGMNDHN